MRGVTLVRRGGAALALAGLAACDYLTDPVPPDADPFEPPAVYARWWAMTEACSGRRGDLAAVRWYRTPGSLMHDGQSLAGYWTSRGNTIVLRGDRVEDGQVVRHEMLHALLRGGGHPHAQFLGTCAGLVSCGGCGEWHPSRRDFIVVPPDSLEVDSRVELLPPEADGQRWVALHVVVRNPRAQPVVATVQGAPRTPTFGFSVHGPSGSFSRGEAATDSSTVYFQPFSTKYRLFEFRVGTDQARRQVHPGVNLIGGSYARRRAPHDSIVVSP